MDSSIRDAIKVLSHFGYRSVRPFAKGGFGSVFKATSPNKEIVAIKMIKDDKCWHIENKMWPKLHHENILPLLERIDITDLGMKLFAMPFQPYGLHQMLSSEDFLADKTGLLRMKRWLVDILKGLQYLHATGYAHLDLKCDNILISPDDRAVICDFSGLNYINVPLQRVCAPRIFKPPECYDIVLYKNIDGAACDIWLFGLLSLNMLTRNWVIPRMGEVVDVTSWKANVESIWKAVLQEKIFCHLMKMAFPSVSIPTEELRLAHHFITSILQWEKNKRPSIQQIMGHPFIACSEFGEGFQMAKPHEVEIESTYHLAKKWIEPKNEYRLSGEVTETKKVETVLKLDNHNHEPLDDEKEKADSPEIEKKNETSNCNFEKFEVGEVCDDETESPNKRRKIGRRILDWVVKTRNRIFRKKKKHVVSDESKC